MLSVKKNHQNTTNQNSVCFTKAHTGAASRWWWWVHMCVGRGVWHYLWKSVSGCGCPACSAMVLISLWQCSCWCCWPRTLWQALVLLHCPPFSPTIPQSLGLHQPSLCQAPKSPVSSCPTLHALTLTCLCSFSRLSPCPSSSILTAQLLTSPLLSLFLTDLISVPPLREDSLPDSTCVSNIISSCNWIWPRGIFSQNGSDWHNALVNCVDLWHLFYSNGKYLNRNSSAGPSFFSSQKLFRWHTYIQEFFFLLSVLLVFSIVPIPQ